MKYLHIIYINPREICATDGQNVRRLHFITARTSLAYNQFTIKTLTFYYKQSFSKNDCLQTIIFLKTVIYK